jgi:hypothetical protein
LRRRRTGETTLSSPCRCLCRLPGLPHTACYLL